MNTLITAKELRASFPTVVRRVRKGARYTVIYRSRPAFQLSPVEESSTPAGDAAGDPLYRAAALFDTALAKVSGDGAAALERAKEIAGTVRAKAVAGAKATDAAVHEHPYQAIAIALGVGAILGYIVARRCSRNCDRS